MALNVKINFENCYEVDDVSDDYSSCSFTTVLNDDTNVLLGVQIDQEAHHLMPDVYNLAFGPFNEKGEIDDQAKLTHADHSKVFSTIVLAAMSFLAEHPNKFVGIDGSNNARAYMYYRCIQNNFAYLSKYFKIYGVNYYARILRKKNDQDKTYPIDGHEWKAFPVLIENPINIRPDKLYNYFIFSLK